MSKEYDIGALVTAVAQEITQTSRDAWDELPPMARFEVSEAVLPLVQAMLAEIARQDAPANTSWDEFINGH